MPIEIIIDIVIVLFGFYVIYLGVSMHNKGEISDSIMAEEEKKKIKDVKGFVDYIYPRFVLFGASVSIISAVSLVSDTIVKIPYWTFAQMILFIVVLLFFSQQFKYAKSNFSKSWHK